MQETITDFTFKALWSSVLACDWTSTGMQEQELPTSKRLGEQTQSNGWTNTKQSKEEKSSVLCPPSMEANSYSGEEGGAVACRGNQGGVGRVWRCEGCRWDYGGVGCQRCAEGDLEVWEVLRRWVYCRGAVCTSGGYCGGVGILWKCRRCYGGIEAALEVRPRASQIQNTPLPKWLLVLLWCWDAASYLISLAHLNKAILVQLGANTPSSTAYPKYSSFFCLPTWSLWPFEERHV